MSHEATLWAWRQSVGNPMCKLVLLHMAESANPGTGNQSWFSLNSIAARCEMSRRTVQTHIGSLIASGHLTLVRKGGPTSGSNRYRVNVGRVSVQCGPAGSDAPMEDVGIANPAIPDEEGVAGAAIGVAGAAIDPMAGAATEPVNTEPVKETYVIGAEAPEFARAKKAIPAPTREEEVAIVRAYLSALPSWPTVTQKRWGESDARKGLLKVWRKRDDVRSVEFWQEFFRTARTVEWWNNGRDGKPLHNARFSWLMTDSKFAHVRELMDELEESR